jgi:hypothetical protein
MRAIPSAPPEQDLLTRSVELSGAQSPGPRGAFCFGLLTDPIAMHTRYPSQTRFVSEPPGFFAVVRRKRVDQWLQCFMKSYTDNVIFKFS